jgi:hypothetical protein
MSAIDLPPDEKARKKYRKTKDLKYTKLFLDNTGHNIYSFS